MKKLHLLMISFLNHLKWLEIGKLTYPPRKMTKKRHNATKNKSAEYVLFGVGILSQLGLRGINYNFSRRVEGFWFYPSWFERHKL